MLRGPYSDGLGAPDPMHELLRCPGWQLQLLCFRVSSVTVTQRYSQGPFEVTYKLAQECFEMVSLSALWDFHCLFRITSFLREHSFR